MQSKKALGFYGLALAASMAFADWSNAKDRGAGTPFGLPHETIGAATTTMAGNKLYVGNLSFGTNDGVMIQLGHVRGWSMDIDPEPAVGDTRCETIVCKMQRVELALRGSGVAATHELKLTYSAQGKVFVTTALENISISFIQVMLLNGGSVVDSAHFPATHTGPLIVGDIGLTPFRLAAQNFTASFEDGRYILRAGVPVRAQIAGHQNELDVDEYIIVYKDSGNVGNNENWNFGSATITGRPSQNNPGATASFGIAGESLIQFGHSHTALNFATMAGGATPGDPDGSVVVSGIGSNGFDGVSIDLTNVPNSGTGSPTFRTIFSEPVSFTPNRGMTITGRGTIGGLPGEQTLGEMRWDGLTPDSMLLTGNAGALDATEMQVDGYLNGVQVVADVRSAGGPLGTFSAAAAGIRRGLEVEIERRSGGFLRGVPPSTQGLAITMKFDGAGMFAPYGGTAVLADEVRISPLDPAQSMDALKHVDLTGHLLDTFSIDSEIAEIRYEFPTQWGGVAHTPIGNAWFAGDPAGDLSVENYSGVPDEFGASLSLGCAQGAAMRFEAGPALPARPILTRATLKSFFETGDVPTQEQFTAIIDSANDGTGNEILELAVFGFTPVEIQATARNNGVVIDQVTHATMPASIATGNLIDGAAPVILSSFAQDTDGNGGLDQAVFFFSEPVTGLITLTGSATGPVDADEIVVTMTLPATFLGTCVHRMDVTSENMLSFVLRNQSIIQFDNPHQSIGGAPILAMLDDGGTGHIDMFMLVGSPAHVMNGDGAVIKLYRNGPPGAGINSDIGGFSFDLLPEVNSVYFNPREYTITKRCSPSLGIPFNEASSISMDLNADNASRTVAVGPVRWMSPESIRSRVYGSDGSVLADSGPLASGPVAVVHSTELPRTADARFTVNSPGGPPTGIEHTFTWDSEVVILLPGQTLQEGRSLRIIAGPGGGSGGRAGGTISPIDMIAAEITATTDDPEAFLLANEKVLPLVPACDADIAAPFGKVDVNDLFLLLAHWNTNGSGADLAPPVLLVDVADLFKLLSSWGDCP